MIRRQDLRGTPQGDAYVFRVAIVIALVILTTTTLWLSNPKIEGALHPVMARDFKVISIRDVEGGTMLSGQATKLRECIWEETIVYRGVRGEAVGALLTRAPHLDKPTVREAGLLVWDRIFLPGIRTVEFKDTYADTVHTCNGRRVRSVLWG